MIEGILTFAYGNFISDGSKIGMFLQKLADNGFFSYLLPFLLIFAVLFAILSMLPIFGSSDANKSKAIPGIISFAIALMSLQFDFVSLFFQQVFPRFGVGLAILLLALITLTFFFPDPKKNNFASYTYFFLGAVILIVILYNSFWELGWGYSALGTWFSDWEFLVGFVALIIIISIIVSSGKPKDTSDNSAPYFKLLPNRN